MKGLMLRADWAPKKDYRITEWEEKTKKSITASSVWRNSKLALEEVETPEIGNKDVLIEVKACGICGTDTHLVENDKDGYVIYCGLIHFPCILGHEFSGIIIKTGKDCEDFKVGDYVTVEEMIWCGECIPCRNGFPNQCERLEEIGITVNGAMAKYIAAPEKLCWSINGLKRIYKDDQLLFDVGAMVEPTSVAYNAIFPRAGGIKPGARVVVFGCGPVGLMGISLLKIAGASKVVVFEVNNDRAELAKKVGADIVYNPIELEKSGITIESIILKETNDQGVDFFLETAGVPEITLPVMLNKTTLNVNAKIVQIARSATETSSNLEPLQTRAAQIFGAQGHSGNGTFENVIRLIEAGMLKPEKVITSRFPIDEGLQAFEIAKKREGAKIIIRP